MTPRISLGMVTVNTSESSNPDIPGIVLVDTAYLIMWQFTLGICVVGDDILWRREAVYSTPASYPDIIRMVYK